MIVSRDKILDFVWDFFKKEFNFEFMRSNQASERPVGTYGTINISAGPSFEGQDEERFQEDGENLKVETTGNRDLTLSVNVYREEAFDKTALIKKKSQTRFFKQNFSMEAEKAGLDLTIIDALTIQDLTSLLQSDYEERFNVDIRLRTVDSIVENIDPIDETTFEGTIKNEADEIVDQSSTTVKIP